MVWVVEVLAWLRGQVESDVAAGALDAVVRYAFHAGRVAALEGAAKALEEQGYVEAARALRVAANAARDQLLEAEEALAEFDDTPANVRVALAKAGIQRG